MPVPDLAALNLQYANLDLKQALTQCRKDFPGYIAFSTSFGAEDQVISDIIFNHQLDITVFTLDTGRHFNETYAVFDATLKKYNKTIKTYYPSTLAVEHFVTINGINTIYESVEKRKRCCAIRKIEPLNRALQGAVVWVTGLRASQSDFRANMTLFEWDEKRQLIKFNPLLHWSTDEIWDYIKTHDVPYNTLHDQGYPSIGCTPCTRAITLGEDERAGRWWWEQDNQECGLHESDNSVASRVA